MIRPRASTSRTISPLASCLAVAILPVLLSLSACGDIQLCKETCTSDDECGAGLACIHIDSPKFGEFCLPKECRKCFDHLTGSITCYVTEIGDPNYPTCEFAGCPLGG
ncbi:MAG: hypothetical protein RBU45_20175 [Myxococcota bacterium]|nr:hypothetical protein [Myxococcota bacterium]